MKNYVGKISLIWLRDEQATNSPNNLVSVCWIEKNPSIDEISLLTLTF